MSSLAVEYAELHALAAALHWQAEQISDEARALTGAVATGDIAQAVVIAPKEVAAAEAAILAAAAKAELLYLELSALGLATSAAAELYQLADEAMTWGKETADGARDWTEDTWEAVGDRSWETAYPWLLDTAIHKTIMTVEVVALWIPGATELSGGHWPTSSHEEAVAGLLALMESIPGVDMDPDLEHGKLRPTGVDPGDMVTIQSLMEFEDTAYNVGHPQVVITEVRGDDGQTRYIVNIPGTEMKDKWGPTGLDTDLAVLSDAVTTMGSPRSELVQEVVEIMREAGITEDSEVMLSGHSLGGMVAASIASDPGLVHDLGIKAIATQGSPIAGYPIDSKVDVLSVEHNQDPIAQLDGADNPRRDNWTTVSVDDPERSANPIGPHASRHYATTLPAHVNDSQVQAWLAQNKNFLGAGVSTAGQTAALIRERGD